MKNRVQNKQETQKDDFSDFVCFFLNGGPVLN